MAKERQRCRYPMSEFYNFEDEVLDGDRTSTPDDCEKCMEENCDNRYCLINDTDGHEDKFPPKTKNPEHKKLLAVKDHSQAIGAFIEWLGEEHNIVFATYDGDFLEEFPFKTKDKWLAEYFEINLDKIEEEKLAMIAELRQ
jgi:hypothetical protein